MIMIHFDVSLHIEIYRLFSLIVFLILALRDFPEIGNQKQGPKVRSQRKEDEGESLCVHASKRCLEKCTNLLQVKEEFGSM